MLPNNLLGGWTRRQLADGLLLFPPGGHAVGALRIKQQVRPLQRIRELIDEAVAELPPGLLGVELSPVYRSASFDGEYTARVTLSARAPTGERVERTIGLVLGDEHYARIDAVVQKEDQFEHFRVAVERLLQNYSLGLGDERRRPFLYTPPPGWQGYRIGFATRYLPPDFPRRYAMLTVFAAKPAELTPPLLQDRQLFEEVTGELERDPPQPDRKVSSAAGLGGNLTRVSGRLPGGPAVFIDQVVLLDTRFVYPLRLESRAPLLEEHRAIFSDVVRSVQPLPHSRKSEGAVALVQWSD
jgi:hypothetical protein